MYYQQTKDDFADNDDSKTKKQDKSLWSCTADAQLKKYENSTVVNKIRKTQNEHLNIIW